jgi:hypothetical protein
MKAMQNSIVRGIFKLLLLAPLLPTTSAFALDATWERFLVPLSVADLSGQLGSRWQSGLVVLNTSSMTLQAGNLRSSSGTIAPNAYGNLPIGIADGSNPGVFFYLKREHSPYLLSQNVVFEASRPGIVAVLPVIRETEFTNEPIHIMDVSADTRHRVRLRVYDRDGHNGALVRVRVIDSSSLMVVSDVHVELRVPTYPASNTPPQPAFGEIPDWIVAPRCRIEITPVSSDTYLWAFVTVTPEDNAAISVILPAK